MAERARQIQPPEAGYSGTPLPKKLGIKPGSTVALVDAPSAFARTLGPLPDGVRLRVSGARDLTVWFVRSASDLTSRIDGVAAAAEGAPLWIAWPKKASDVKSDLSETVVREAGLALGLVDYKVCAIDSTWSGLLFARRR